MVPRNRLIFDAVTVGYVAFDNLLGYSDYDALRELISFDAGLVDFVKQHQEQMLVVYIAFVSLIAADFDLEKEHRTALNFVDVMPLIVLLWQLGDQRPMESLHIEIQVVVAYHYWTNFFEAVWVDLGYFWKIFAELSHYLNRGALAVVDHDEEVGEAHLRTADGEFQVVADDFQC